MSLAPHVGFFLLLALAIVVMSAFYSDEEDASALRSIPKRYAIFVCACASVAAIMLVLEHLFAGLS